MLPDMRAFKQELAEKLRRRLELKVIENAPSLGQIKTRMQREGDRYSYQSHDGDIHHDVFKPFRTPMTTQIVPGHDAQEREVLEQLDQAAARMASQFMKLLYETVTESSKRVGTTLDAKGQPFHMGLFIDALERMSVDFDDEGRPIFPEVHLHPDQFEAIKPKLKGWSADKTLTARMDRVVATKKDEWRAREARRKLVG